MQATNITEIIKGVFLNPDNASREVNQVSLQKFVELHPDAFVEQTSSEFQNNKLQSSMRVLLATALKMTLQKKKGEAKSSFWFKLSASSKEMAKMAGLNSLVDPVSQVRSAAAGLTGLVYVLDFVDDRKYVNLLGPICANIQHEDKNVRQASIQTLGNICELLGQMKVSNFDANSFDLLATGICMGLRSTDDSRLIAVKTLCDSVSFIRIKFENEQFADFVFTQLLVFLEDAKKENDYDLFQTLIQTFSEIVKVNFKGLDKYHYPIFKVMVECMSIHNEKNQIVLSEFWIRVLRFEKRFQRKYLDPFWQALLEQTLSHLFARLNSEFEPEDGLAENLIELMRGVNRLYINQSFPFLLKFVQENWETDKEPQKTTAICVFDSLVESSPLQAIGEPLNQSFLWVLNSVKNGLSLRVSFKAIELLTQVAVCHPSVLFGDINFGRLMDDYLGILRTKALNTAQLQLKQQVAKAMGLIIDSAGEEERYLGLLKGFSGKIQESLFAAIETENDYTLMDFLMSSFFSLIHKGISSEEMGDCFAKLMRAQSYVLERYQGENKILVFEATLINLDLILKIMKKENRHLVMRDKDAISELRALFLSVDNLQTKSGQILPDAVILMTSILLYSPREFDTTVREFYDKYIKNGLTNVNMEQQLRASIESFAALFRVFSRQFADQIGNFLEYVFVLLRNPDLPQTARIALFYFVTDVVSEHPQLMGPYLGNLLELIHLGLEAVVYLQTTEPEVKQSVHFCQEFRELLVENLHMIILGMYLTSDEFDREIESRFVGLQVAVKKTCETAGELSVDYSKFCLYLLNDFYAKKHIAGFVDLVFVGQLCEILKRNPSDPAVLELLDEVRRSGLMA